MPDREYKIKVVVSAETAETAKVSQAYATMGAEGQRHLGLLHEAAERLNLSHREEHVLLRQLGGLFGPIGEVAHYGMFGPIGAGIGVSILGVKLLTEHFQKLHEAAVEAGKKAAEAFDESTRHARELSNAVIKLNDDYAEFNTKLEENHRKSEQLAAERALEQAHHREAAETEDDAHRMDAAARRREEIARALGASPAQIEALHQAAADRAAGFRESQAAGQATRQHDQDTAAAEAAAKAARDHLAEVEGTATEARLAKERESAGTANADAVRKGMVDAIARYAAGGSEYGPALILERHNLKKFDDEQAALKHETEQKEKELSDAKARQTELDTQAAEHQRRADESGTRAEDAQRTLQTGTYERAQDAGLRSLLNSPFGNQVLAAIQAMQHEYTGAEAAAIRGRRFTPDPHDVTAIQDMESTLRDHGIRSNTALASILQYLRQNANDLDAVNREVQGIWHRLSFIPNMYSVGGSG